MVKYKQKTKNTTATTKAKDMANIKQVDKKPEAEPKDNSNVPPFSRRDKMRKQIEHHARHLKNPLTRSRGENTTMKDPLLSSGEREDSWNVSTVSAKQHYVKSKTKDDQSKRLCKKSDTSKPQICPKFTKSALKQKAYRVAQMKKDAESHPVTPPKQSDKSKVVISAKSQKSFVTHHERNESPKRKVVDVVTTKPKSKFRENDKNERKKNLRLCKSVEESNNKSKDFAKSCLNQIDSEPSIQNANVLQLDSTNKSLAKRKLAEVDTIISTLEDQKLSLGTTTEQG